jgi:hypothetical protein
VCDQLDADEGQAADACRPYDRPQAIERNSVRTIPTASAIPDEPRADARQNLDLANSGKTRAQPVEKPEFHPAERGRSPAILRDDPAIGI